MRTGKAQGRPRIIKHVVTKPVYHHKTKPPDWMRELVKMGKPQSVIVIDNGQWCELGVCNGTAVHFLIFRTDTMKLCQRHYDEWQKRRENGTR